MSNEFPTLTLSANIDQTKSIVKDAAKRLNSEVVTNDLHYTLSTEYKLELTGEEVERKVAKIASERYHPKTVIFLAFGIFTLILSILALNSGKFEYDDAVKSEKYFLSLQESEEKTRKLKRIERKKGKAQTMWSASGIAVTVSLILFSFAYRSKVKGELMLKEARKEIERELEEKGMLTVDQRKTVINLRFYESENDTDIIIEEEEGSPIIIYLLCFILEIQNKLIGEAKNIGNIPLGDLISRFESRNIVNLTVDKNLLQSIEI